MKEEGRHNMRRYAIKMSNSTVFNNVVEAHGYGFRSTVERVSIHVARQVQ